MIWKDQRLLRLVYISAVGRNIGRSDLVEMAKAARAQREQGKITGMLLCAESAFFEILEGPAQAVEKVFDQVETEPRNAFVTPLLRERPFFRIFKTWSLGCDDLAEEETPIDAVFRPDWEEIRLRAGADKRRSAHRFLERFYEAHLSAGRVAAF